MNYMLLFLILNLAFLLSLNAKPKIYLIETADEHDDNSINTYAEDDGTENVNKSENSIEADNSSEIMSKKRRAGKGSKASDGGWSEWGACSKTRGPGTGMKTRKCTSKGRWDCRGPSRQPCCTIKPFCDFITPDATDVLSKDAEAYMKEILKKNPGFKLVEGDMLLNRKQQKTYGKKPSNADYEDYQALAKAQWPNNKLYYTFDKTVPEGFRNNIRSAVAELRGKLVGCIEIVEGVGSNYAIVSAKRNRQCVSMVGVNRFDKNTINFDETRCDHKGVIQHEFIHALGIFHHQSRKDRDKYVKIHWKNIVTAPDMTHNFLKQKAAKTYNLPYDYTSIMHYGGTFFSKKRFGPDKLLTIETRNPKYQNIIGRQDHISDGDIKLIKTYYGCKKDNEDPTTVSETTIKSTTEGESAIGKIGKGRRFDYTTVQVTSPSKKASGYTECCTVCQAAAPDTSLYMYNSQDKRCYCRKPLPGVSLITNVARSADVAGFCDAIDEAPTTVSATTIKSTTEGSSCSWDAWGSCKAGRKRREMKCGFSTRWQTKWCR